MYSFTYLEPVCCSMFSSNCCYLTYIQISQEAGYVVRYSHLLKNFLQFVVVHTVKGFGIVNKAEVDIFLELSCFFDDSADVGNLIPGSPAFSKTSLNNWKFTDSVSFLESWSYRSLPVSLQLFFCENFSTQKCIFGVFMGGGEFTLPSWFGHSSFFNIVFQHYKFPSKQVLTAFHNF